MQKSQIFSYAWHVDEKEKDVTAIRIYGLNEKNENVCIRVNNFTPYVYLELPDDIQWTESKANMVARKIDQLSGNKKPLTKCFTYKYRLYYAYLDKNDGYKRKKFPYLLCLFSNESEIKALGYKIRRPMNVTGIGTISVKMHEHNASPILQFVSQRKIPTAGWFEFIGKPVAKDDKITLCDHEYIVKWKNTAPLQRDDVVKPLIMSFDIEVNSSNLATFPNADRPGDKVFQISCILHRDNADDCKKYLLTLGDPDQKNTGEDVTILKFNSESDLLVGFTSFIQKYNPNVIVGYNILGFDIPYMIDRAKTGCNASCIYEFDQQGFTKFAHSKETTIKWSSSAYKNQTFQFLDAEGRLFVDLLPLVKRDYKFSNYQLKTVSSFFLKQTKDDLDPQGIFKCYRIGMKGGKKGARALSVVGKYCVQDTVLVAKLFDKLQTWVGLTEMAKVCNVPPFYLYTQGQQIKVFSQIYLKCTHENIVVEKDGYIPKDDEHYVGAKVFDPVVGVHDRVIPFDFSSLYPTTIIAYNIDYSTLVVDPDIPDEMCHVMEWEDHQGCLVKGSRVTVGEYSVPIEELTQYKNKLLAYNAENDGLSYYDQTNFFNQGIKDCVELVFEDGFTLRCTPDHRLLLNNGDWVEAQNIKLGVDRLKTGYSPPVYKVKGEKLVIDEFEFEGENLIKFYKLLGLFVTDGHASKGRTKLYCGHPMDLSNVVRDIESLGGVVRAQKENYGWGVTILGRVGEIFRNLSGVLWGKKSTQTRTMPNLLEHASEGELCSFLSGLFGGDGHTFSWSEKSGAIGCISLSWTGKEEDLQPIFTQLQIYLLKCGIQSSVTRHGNETILHIRVEDSCLFRDKIGFSYCVHKSMRLEAGCSYLQLRDKVWKQQQKLVDRVRVLKKTMTTQDATKTAIQELHSNEPVYNQYYSSPSSSQMTDLLRSRKKWKKPMFSLKHFPSPIEYFKSISAYEFFLSDNNVTYSVDRKEKVLPCLHKRIVFRKNIGKQQVYDLEVGTSHSFLADGVVVHNCIHDPKIIRKEKLTKYIADEKKELTLMRKNRKGKKGDVLIEHNLAIEQRVKDLKPYQEERTELNKTKPKHIMCTPRYYRFLKEPLGVLPSLLKNLLDARSHTKKEMKGAKNKLNKTLDSKDRNALDTLFTVLNKRQLAYKVSANSGYGAMGVQRGYLPFMPGAMATTAMGRKSIEIVAEVIPRKFKGTLVYGDTDCVIESTPVLIRDSFGQIDYKTVEEIGDGNWERINPNKEMCKAKKGYEIWSDQGFTQIVNVVRCGVKKPLSRILTHVGEVTCSNEHSLLRDNLESVTPLEVKLKDKLCITEFPLPEDTPKVPLYKNRLTTKLIEDYELSNEKFEDITAKLAFVWGMFYADGSCGSYESGAKKYTWALNNQDNNLLERCKDILLEYHTKMDFKILESSNFNKLAAVQLSKKLEHKGDIGRFVKYYRGLFYDEHKNKKIPKVIFNAPFSIRQAFFMGYYAGDGSKKDPAISLSNKGAIGSAGLFFLMKSLGYQVSINSISDKPNVFKLTGSTPEKKMRYVNAVKKIIPMENVGDYIYDIQTENHHFSAGVGQLVVHNSNYIAFPHLENATAAEIWEYSEYVAAEVTKLFPPPMNLAFEEIIYWRFLILSKKRYMSLACEKDGIVKKKIEKKGVLLARRDNCNFIRKVYGDMIMNIFEKKDRDDIIYQILQEMNMLCGRGYSYTEFITTQSIGDVGGLQPIPFIDEKGKSKVKIGDYTVTPLSTDPDVRRNQLMKKNADNDTDYYLYSLPAQVQCAEKMRRRGKAVEAGSRLEFVVTDQAGTKAKKYENIESAEYFAKHSTTLTLDYMYYLKQMVNPIDQVLNALYVKNATHHKYKLQKHFILNQYKYRLRVRGAVIKEINELFSPKLKFED